MPRNLTPLPRFSHHTSPTSLYTSRSPPKPYHHHLPLSIPVTITHAKIRSWCPTTSSSISLATEPLQALQALTLFSHHACTHAISYTSTTVTSAAHKPFATFVMPLSPGSHTSQPLTQPSLIPPRPPTLTLVTNTSNAPYTVPKKKTLSTMHFLNKTVPPTLPHHVTNTPNKPP